MKTAAAYIRVSTDDQLEFSPDSQLKLIEDYAAKNGITLLEDYIFMEESGISGKTMSRRPEFMRMINLCKKKPKPFDVILLWKFSRFSREQSEAIAVKAMLKKNGIEVISISEPLPEGPFGELIERIVEWQDSYYLINLSQEVKRGMKEKASRGLPVVPPPIGYNMENGMYVPSADAPLIAAMFSDFLNGIGLRALAVKYSSLGLKTTRGNPLDNRCVEYILRNPVYVGKIRWSEEGKAASKRKYDNDKILIFDGKHEAIVTEGIFDKVQEKLDEQKRLYGKHQRPEQSTHYMLKGLVRCSNCGATLVYQSTKSPALQCHNYARGNCHISHSVTVAKAEASIIEYLEKAIAACSFNIVTQSGNASAGLPKEHYKKLIENEKAKLNRIKLAYQNGIDTIDEYRYNKAKVLEEISKLEKAAAEETPKINMQQYAKKATAVLDIIKDENQTAEAKNKALRTIIQRIVYNKSLPRFEVYFY